MHRSGIEKSQKTLWERIDQVWQNIGVAASSICLILMLAEIFLRYIAKKPLMGVEEITCMIAFWAYFMGAVHGSYEGSHISGQVTQVLIKNPRILNIVNTVTSFITVFIACYVSVWAYKYFIWGVQRGETSPFLMIPRVYSQSAISVGLVLMAFYFIVDFIKNLNNLLAHRATDGKNLSCQSLDKEKGND